MFNFYVGTELVKSEKRCYPIFFNDRIIAYGVIDEGYVIPEEWCKEYLPIAVNLLLHEKPDIIWTPKIPRKNRLK